MQKFEEKIEISENYEISLHDRLSLNTYSARVELSPDLTPLLVKWLS